MNIKVVIISVISLLAVGATGFYLLNNSNSSNSNSFSSSDEIELPETAENHPFLEIVLTDYPTFVDHVCEPFDFTFKVKNHGNEALHFSDIGTEYFFYSWFSEFINEGETVSGVDILDYYGAGLDELLLKAGISTIDDFGTILPGEEKSITVHNINYIDYGDGEYLIDNNTSFLENGDHKVNIGFAIYDGDITIAEPRLSDRLSTTEPVTIQMDTSFDEYGIDNGPDNGASCQRINL